MHLGPGSKLGVDMHRFAFIATAALLPGSVLAQSVPSVTFLGAFDGGGGAVQVTPLSDTRVELCWETIAGPADCSRFGYSLDDGTARFFDATQGAYVFDLVTNVLTLTRADGARLTADMTPVAR